MTASLTAVRFGRSILRFVMPPLCLVCHAPVAADHALCVGCWSNVVFIEPPVCDRLGIPFPYEQGEGAISAAAIADPPNWGRRAGL
jgi:predicted amidophosphoribosyltransferase